MTEFTQDELATLGELIGLDNLVVVEDGFRWGPANHPRIPQAWSPTVYFAADVLTKLTELGTAPTLIIGGGATCWVDSLTTREATWPLAVLKAAAHYQLAKRKVTP